MPSQCKDCINARGLEDGLTHSPGDEPGDACICTNLEFLSEFGYELTKDPKYGWGLLVYRIEALEGEDAVCEWGTPR